MDFNLKKMERPSANMKMTDGITGHDYERELNKYIDYLEAEGNQLNLDVVSNLVIDFFKWRKGMQLTADNVLEIETFAQEYKSDL